MGFTTERLCNSDKDIIARLEHQIVVALGAAWGKMSRDTQYSKIWFGDTSAQWIARLQSNLHLMICAIMDTEKSIEIIGPHGVTDSGGLLTDYARLRLIEYNCNRTELPDHLRYPIHGESDMFYYIHMPNRPYKLLIAPGWYYAPTNRPPHAPPVSLSAPLDRPGVRYSKFHILVHGLSELILETRDIKDGYDDCLYLVETFTENAKINSDNWAFFVEDAGRI